MPVSISGDGIISGVSTLTTGNFITTSSISAPTATFTGNVSIGGTLTYEDVTNVDSIGIITARSGVIISGVTTVSAGSASAPSITPSGDSNTGIFFPAADTIAFAEGGAEAVRIDSSGRMGVGTTTPVSTLNIRKDSLGTGGVAESAITLTYSSTNYGQHFIDANGIYNIYANNNGVSGGNLQFRSDASLIFNTASSERARIDSSGKFLVGTNTASSNIYYTTVATNPSVQFETAVNSYSNGLSLINYSSMGYTPVLTLGSSSSSTQGVQTALANSYGMGAIQFAGSDGTNFRTGASIIATNDQTASWAVGDCPTRLTFHTTSDGASSPTERLRIDNAGRVTLPSQPSFRVYSPSGAAFSIITFASTEYNIGNHMNASTGVFTAPIAGRYLFTFAILCGNPYGSYVRINFCKNSTNIDTTLGDTLWDGLTTYGSPSMAMIFSLAANDTIRLRAEGTGVYGTNYGSFSGCLIG